MNCDDYLSRLATAPIDEMTDVARDHATRCHECDRVTRVVTAREHNMRMAFGDLSPSVPAEQLAARAVVLSRRRTVAFYYRIALGVATAASLSYLIAGRQASVPAPDVSETFHLQCLSPEQAAEVIRSGIASRSMGIRIQPSSPLGIIRINAPPEEMERARSVLQRYDSPAESQCDVQITLPRVVKVR